MNRTIAAASVAALFMGGVTAQAADLGGNCCADLEERVAELEATTARKGNRKVSVEVSGQVNVGFIKPSGFSALDLANHEIIDNENSESRFRFIGGAQISSNWSASYVIELGLASLTNGSGNVALRQNYLKITSKQLGSFSLGHRGTATDGIVEVRLDNGAVAATMGSLTPFDSFVKRQVGVQLDNPFDGTRAQSVRYDTPSIGGFQLSAAWQDNDGWDAALRYANEFGGLRVAAGVGYRHDEIGTTLNSAPNDRQFAGGSLSVMHVKSGLYINGMYGQSKGLQTGSFDIAIAPTLTPRITGNFALGEATVTTWAVSGGIQRKWSPMGATNIGIEYGKLEINALAGVDPTLYGVYITQDIDAAAMNLYASYRHLDADLGTGSDGDVFVAGARIKF